jgi:murein DD-endopeptidase MepM/ murein hydrolase activator NlpD
VKAGDKVKVGQELAQCGNSGNSPFPHLHYHVQTTSQWFKGEGLPIQFHDYVADGKPVSVGEPVRGQVVQSK